MKRYLLGVLLAVFIGMTTGILPVFADEEIQDQPVQFDFNEQITFHSIFRTDIPVELAVIFFQAKNDTRTFVELATIEKLDHNEYDLKHTHLTSRHHFQAFTTIEYRYEILLEGGDVFKSPMYEFLYTDNRFEWESLQEGPFIVYWFDGDYAFAQSILDVAQEGLAEITGILPLPEPDILHIYTYPDATLLQDAMNPSGEDWIAGHAYPDLQTMILYLPPNSDHILDMRQRIPHEIMHILLYQMTGAGYKNLPFWLVEGLASIVELYPNPDYAILLDNAFAKNVLIPMSSLCLSFPRDASGALLAYAQSASFTDFLYANYGSQGLQQLISDYADGKDCENGAQSALGTGLVQLERRWWRESLSGSPALTAFIRILPWLTILLLIFIAPVGLIVVSLRSKRRREKDRLPPEQVAAVKSSESRL